MSVRERIEAALAASEQGAALREAFSGEGEEGGGPWLVGGAIRDALAGRPITDIDLAVGGEAEPVARRVARLLDGDAFELSGEFDTWRAAGGGWTVDVAALRAGSIEEDLRLRDFSVNAIAVPLAGGEPIDPTGGIEALERRSLDLAHPAAFEDDPLRLMRAARLAAGFELAVAPETVRRAREAAPRAAEPAGERRFAELRGMLCGASPLRGLELLDELGVTAVVLPELEALKGVGQSANHHLDVYRHTLEVLRRWLTVESDLESYAGPAAEAVAAALQEPLADELTRREGVRFAALLHDIGKPATRTERDGLVGFRGHDAVGAEMVRRLCGRLRTSRRFADFQAALTRHHLVLGFMTHERPLSRRRIWDYISLTGREAIDVTMLTVADRLSAQGSRVAGEGIRAHLELAQEMLAEIVAFERDGPPEPLLNGAAIAELLGIQGEAVGAAVRELAAAQFAAEVSDRAEAVAHLQAWARAGAGRGTEVQ